ncbi:MAG: long-chain fatty acid--CoA ligase [Acidimicrobiales bacterium]
MAMLSTMQDVPLSITSLFRHGQRVHRRARVETFDGQDVSSATFAEVGERAERLAAALRRLGVGEGDRVATFMWNTQEHLEAYFAVPCMGSVLHTLNLRLFPQQLVYIANEAEDQVVLAHASVLPALAAVAGELKTVRHVVVVDDGAPVSPEVAGALPGVVGYEELLAGERPGFAWPEVDERSAAIMCYTSGTTGDPKGVVYSHRSTFLHTFVINNCGAIAIGPRDRLMVVVPMFHVNAWGHPFAAWMLGTDLVMPARYLQGGPLTKLIGLARPTVSAGVPTIWADLLRHVRTHPDADISSLRVLLSGGSALPRAIIEGFDPLGIPMLQGWGMTETSPLCTVSYAPPGFDPADVDWRLKTGRIVPGVEARIVADDGTESPWDGETTGEIEVRGPWITGSYYMNPSPEKFNSGWLRTGDIGSIDDYGYLQISDRSKDVIKSGGEWISSVELENEIMGHPEVAEATVVGVPDDKWGERPLAAVVRSPGSIVTPGELRAWLEGRVARWWVPERWAFIESVPKTSVGKFDKKAVRATYAAGELDVQRT